ncbi:alcohol dehydrogenase [Acetobacter sp. AN02]|uniref:alcohol dehydrogenase n=1 Tax=Acetobacter sp. AN02 TaxID=2894186 RepID=UPI002434130F|nr:alcohol dehydrogenase [Acetobacter sp. AN02]MDG6095768.1 alcohol dehydrogenase [Acetobacter sp. AN02]
MTRFMPLSLAASGLAAVLVFAAPGARAQDEGSSNIMKQLPNATQASVAGASPVNVAGALNYCIETEAVSDEDGTPTLVSLSKKYDAVPADHAGNKDYAIGTAGEFVAGGQTTTITGLPADDQKKLCGTVLSRAKSLL